MRCQSCGQDNKPNANYCRNCGHELDKPNFKEYTDYEVIYPSESKQQDVVYCPKCGSTNIHFVTKEKGSDFDVTYGCCGYIIFGPLGILCGLFSDKKTDTVRKCMSCTNEF